MKIHVKTYGCQMNERDSESVTALLMRSGHEAVEAEADADVILVNTCSVRGKAEHKALGKLGLLTSSKRGNPERIVGAMGCMVQRMGQKLFDKVPNLDFAVGTQRFSRVAAILDRINEGERQVLDVALDEGYPDELSGHREGKLSAFVNILLGCDRNCTYCVVPAVRGHEWSRPGDKVVAEVRSIAENGVREVTLLGQSVMSYGRRQDVWPGDHVSLHGYHEPLPRLLEAVSGIQGIERVRFTSGHPRGCTAELADAMADIPEVCDHLHLPVQSGSDRILDLMKRGYVSGDYREAVARLRNRMPELAVTTDIIVGFPGETVEEFEITRAFMDEIGFDNAFIFKYSPRPGTKAEAWEDNVPADEKLRRNKVLLDDQDRRGMEINEGLVGCEVEVLVEGVSLRNEQRWSGRSTTHKIVVFEPVEGMTAGDIVKVKIERIMAQTMYGIVERAEG